uniref:Tetraspanin n=1 Tax=Magallana gigas TaxID=29159 RepID=A0A8W8KST8_MAGGI|nr:tetraspanin-9-like isoform X1 [Crassostrea gigas]XP_034299753.1 tetraspanin-9-like isoform X1 [Crassostrea gigas]
MAHGRPSKHEIALIIINMMLLVIGLALIIVGGLVVRDVSSINKDHVRLVLDSITVGISKLGGLVSTLSILMILIGVLILAVTGLGLFGIFCRNKYMLITFAIIVLLLLIPQITVVSLWNKIETELQDKMIEALEKSYKDDTILNSNSLSKSWNFIFMTQNCCGVTRVDSTTNDFDKTSWCTTSGSCQATSSQIPRGCCKNITESTYTSAPATCYASVNPGTYHSKGCYGVIKGKMLSLTPSITGVIVTATFLQIVAGTFALWYSYQLKNG